MAAACWWHAGDADCAGQAPIPGAGLPLYGCTLLGHAAAAFQRPTARCLSTWHLHTQPASGQVEVRRADSGEVVYRDHLSCPVAAIMRADYRNDGMEQVVVCGVEGEVSWWGWGTHTRLGSRLQHLILKQVGR